MANDMDRLTRRMKRHAKQIETGASQMTRKVALAIDQTVVLANPVDTGRSRSNWVVEVGRTPPTGEREPYAPGSKLGSGEGANAQAAIRQGQQAIATYNNENESIFIANNVKYISKLNEGSSPQAEAGFIQTAIARGVSVARGFKILRSSQ